MNKKGAADDTSTKAVNRIHGSIKESLSMKEVLDLLILVGWTRDMIRKARQKELAPYGLNPDKAGVLQVIQNCGGSATTNDIARQILRERHSTHELLRRMEKTGLLREISGIHRKNGVSFGLTDKGREAYRHISKRPLQQKIFSSLSKKQRDELSASLRILFNAAAKALEKNSI